MVTPASSQSPESKPSHSYGRVAPGFVGSMVTIIADCYPGLLVSFYTIVAFLAFILLSWIALVVDIVTLVGSSRRRRWVVAIDAAMCCFVALMYMMRLG